MVIRRSASLDRITRAGLRNEVKTARHALRPLPPVRFVIFAKGRTGSTLLTSTLDTHPQIACMDEFLGLPWAFPIRFVENTARVSGAHCFGFHVKIYQLISWQRIGDVSGWLAAIQGRGWKILHLRRENLLRHVVSYVFAEAAGTYHHRASEATKRPDRITLPPKRLRDRIENRCRHIDAERRALAGLDHLELVNECDLEAPKAQFDTFARIQSYLRVKFVPLSTPLKNAVVKPLHNLIDTYEAVRKILSVTPDEVFLHG